MKLLRLFCFCGCFFHAQAADDFLSRAGENRPELEKALQSPYSKEIRGLLEQAPTSDLVNLTALHLIENSFWAGQARRAFPWPSKIPDAIWCEYVLPYRIAEEDLDPWRLELYCLASKLVKDAPSGIEAAKRINAWLYSPGSPTRFVVSESRDMSPRQQLRLGHGRCWELNILFTALCRAVGIPCRMQGAVWWLGADYYHYWSQVYDESAGQWVFCEPALNGLNVTRPTSQTAIVMGYPAVTPEHDLLNRHRFDLLKNFTEPVEPNRGSLRVQVFQGAVPQTNCLVSLYVFNLNAWRIVWQDRTDAQGAVAWSVGANQGIAPLLVSAFVGGNLVASSLTISSNRTTSVLLNAENPQCRLDGMCIPMKK